MDKLHALASILKANGLRMVFVGCLFFGCFVYLMAMGKLDNQTFGSCTMALMGFLFPSMASEHFAPKAQA